MLCSTTARVRSIGMMSSSQRKRRTPALVKSACSASTSSAVKGRNMHRAVARSTTTRSRIMAARELLTEAEHVAVAVADRELLHAIRLLDERTVDDVRAVVA